MKTLPQFVRARWSAEDWDEERMEAGAYMYEAIDGEGYGIGPADLSEDEAGRYSWSYDITAGAHVGNLKMLIC
jgi:hypothetical protein